MRTIKTASVTLIVFSIFLGLDPIWAQSNPSKSLPKLDCIQIFHDPGDNQYPLYLKNLLGHFPQFESVTDSIDHYQKGQIENCSATFYLGSTNSTSIPEIFLNDFESTKKRVAWIGSSIDQLGPSRLASLFGHRYRGLTQPDSEHLDGLGRPTFFRTIHYKGEKFETSSTLANLERINDTGVVLSEAEHGYSHQRVPYIIQNKNHFHVGDIPFINIDTNDRYLVFSDLLFDILDTPPLYPERHPALIRIEDVSVTTSYKKLNRLIEALNEVQVPAQIALIPIFADPLGVTGHDPTGKGVPISQSPSFMATLQKLQASGTSIIWHGVTHQYGNHKNPLGVSAVDYEFLISSTGKPIPEDSVDYVLNLLNRGWSEMEQSGMHPILWEVPHYAASALDYTLFGRLFSWNYGRIRYVPHEVTGLSQDPADTLQFDKTGLKGDAARRSFFRNLKIKEIGKTFSQFFPYEIYRDFYGQRVLPENLNYPCAAHGQTPARTLEMILDEAKKNRVIRDYWASFFIHISEIERLDAQSPDEPEAGLHRLIHLVKSLQSLGYEFQNANEWVRLR